MQVPTFKAIANETVLQVIAVVLAAAIIASIPKLRALVHEGKFSS
jgi:hypothetical protein